MPKRLSGLEGAEISLVPKAANRRRFLLLKGDTEMFDEVKALEQVAAIDKAGLGDAVEALASTAENASAAALLKDAGLNETETARVKAAFRVLGEELGKKVLAKATPADEGDGKMPCPECGAMVSKEAKFCPECGAGMKAGAKKAKSEDDMTKGAKISKADDGTWDLSAIAEDQRPAIEAVLKAQDAETAVLKEKVEKESKERARLEDEKQKVEFIRQAGEFAHLPGAKADDLGPILRKAAGAMEPKEYEKLREVLKGADKIAEDSALFTELGAAGPGTGDGSAYGKITALAEELRKGDTKLSPEQAKARIIKTHPELFKQHQAELDLLKRAER